MRELRGKCLWVCLLGLVMACGMGTEPATEELSAEGVPTEEVEATESGLHRRDVEAVTFSDPLGVGDAANRERRLVLASETAYRRVFGHPAPAEVDFAAGDAVIFYSAGTKRTGGYRAMIENTSLTWTGFTLKVWTQLESPGPDCIVTEALTTPYVLAKVRLPEQTRWVRFATNDYVRNCGEPTDPCAAVLCIEGTRCEVRDVQCVTTPCEPQAVCVPIEEESGPMCGGIAGIECPGLGSCVDDPDDSCDPARGGADCSGVCRCKAVAKCSSGQYWDSSPEVCACRDEVKASCEDFPCEQGTHCEIQENKATCVKNTGVQCGKNTCASGMVCCNASCGICTPPNGVCIQLACTG